MIQVLIDFNLEITGYSLRGHFISVNIESLSIILDCWVIVQIEQNSLLGISLPKLLSSLSIFVYIRLILYL